MSDNFVTYLRLRGVATVGFRASTTLDPDGKP